ncbi:MAG: hypothetical protein WAS55_13260 [Saprospiraceae bacterium]
METIRLFNLHSIDTYLASIDEKIKQELLSSSTAMLSGDPAEMAKRISDKYKVNIPVFDYNSTSSKVEHTPERYMNRIVMTDYVIYEIPFRGDINILSCRPNRGMCQIGYPLEVSTSNSKISFYINSQGLVHNTGEPRERVKRHAQSIRDFIDCSLAELKISINEWNNSLETLLFEGIKVNKEHLQNMRSKQQSLEDDLNIFK